MKLPPGVNARQFDAAVKRFQAVVGPDWVFTSDQDVNLYRDAYTPFYGEDEELVPSGAVGPESVEQVQEIVRIANQFRIPLWPVSTGRNLGYGGAAPRMSGTLVLDLKRINKVLEVNDTLAYAIVEPGVSYFDFYRYLRTNNHALWIDCPDPGWGSVIGNALDHGVGHTPHRDHFDSHCGMEVVLANGELMRTGMGALPGSPNWATYKYGFGPHLSPIFGQANYGIVTKMGMWLYPEPEAARNDLVDAHGSTDIVPFIDTLARLANLGVLDSSWQVGSPLMQSRDPEIVEAIAKGAPAAEMERLGRAKNLPYWSVRLRFYGPQEVIDAKWRYTQQQMSAAIPGVTFRAGVQYRFPIDPASIAENEDSFQKAAIGIPEMSIFNFGGASRSQGHVFFSPIIPMSGKELMRAQGVFTKAFADLGMRSPGTLGGWSWYKRNLVLLFNMPITRDPAANRKMRENYRALVKISAANGWGEYRAAPAFMDDIADSFSFNDHALRRFQETIKDAVDPNGILAPGKSGIWPKQYRRTRA
jgi:FAD/FMN-containing dehydrogenase